MAAAPDVVDDIILTSTAEGLGGISSILCTSFANGSVPSEKKDVRRWSPTSGKDTRYRLDSHYMFLPWMDMTITVNLESNIRRLHRWMNMEITSNMTLTQRT